MRVLGLTLSLPVQRAVEAVEAYKPGLLLGETALIAATGGEKTCDLLELYTSCKSCQGGQGFP